MPNFISEEQIEIALMQLLVHEQGYEQLNCHTTERDNLNDQSGRASKKEVLLRDRLKAAAIKLNPQIPEKAIDAALEKFSDRRVALSLIAANEEVYDLIKNGVPVEYDDEQGKHQEGRVYLIKYEKPTENSYLLVRQLWVQGPEGNWRRPDVMLYVNGIPLVFIELKNSNIKLKNAFDDNLTTYLKEIPQLFHYNAFCMLTNAVETRLGSITAEWEHYFHWLRVADEKEPIDRKTIRETGTSLERVVTGLLSKPLLLDYVENFILYFSHKSKIIAQNHQFLGVNRAYDKFQRRAELEGKLGVFWHTQGSGKSYSMIFYVRKIFRKETGNFSFVVVTDRDELDGQIYKNFLRTETVKKEEAAQPKNSEELRKFLGQNKRLVFTLIHKFRWDKGKTYPLLSDRSDIIVIVDEAHRTQYKSLAENMRAGLKNAQYLAFTGTPLLGKERKTNAWFGDYVSEYNFRQSVDDGATVPLFYQKRVPQVLIQNDELEEDFYEILEDEKVDEAQKEKLEKKYAQQIEVIKRDDRLETIARDMVYHFPRRGYLGKGMMVSLDKFTAVKMYDKVKRLWQEHIRELLRQIRESDSIPERVKLQKIVDYMRKVEMAVVISEEADEEKKFAEMKLDIKPHRARMNKLDEHGADVEDNFKDPKHPLQLVFVCAMWLTGFDAPTVSTLYLDKPMKDHTLMQTIARANRVTSFKIDGVEKKNGEIVDYFNVFRNMKKALKDYAQGDKGQDELPVSDKSELLELLADAIAQGKAYCQTLAIDLEALLLKDDVFRKVEAFQEHANTLLTKDEWWKGFNVYENMVTSLYEACKPEVLGTPVVREVAVFQYLRGVIDSIIEQQDVSKVAIKIGELLDQSLVVDDSEKKEEPGYRITQVGREWNLSKLNFEKLEEEFKQTCYKNIEIADLRAFLAKKLEQMLQANSTRTGFMERLQGIINNYNAGSASTENYFADLVNFTKDLKEEDERHIREGLSEDELELFDLLKKEQMTKEEEQKVKLAAKSLLRRLLEESPKVLVQDWFKDAQTREQVRSAMETVLDKHLPESYSRSVFTEKCNRVFEMMHRYASMGNKWVA